MCEEALRDFTSHLSGEIIKIYTTVPVLTALNNAEVIQPTPQEIFYNFPN